MVPEPLSPSASEAPGVPEPAGSAARSRGERPSAPTVLWWGRFDADYSRNRVIRRLLSELGWRVVDFVPRLSRLGNLEAVLKGVPGADLVWVPCFRQRDVAAAVRWARKKRVPLLFDPLISAFDKQVSERNKFPEDSPQGRRLLAWEKKLFQSADLVLADTRLHAGYFTETFGVPEEKLAVVPVGAEEPLFTPAPMEDRKQGAPLHVLFYGSFIGLQGPDVIVEAARVYEGPPVAWHLLGAGPMLDTCRARAEGLDNVAFEPWIPYADLPARIHRAELLLGVFGESFKAGRVIPNKVFQALACGRAVITRESDAYPEELMKGAHGITFVPPGDPKALAAAVARAATLPEELDTQGANAAAAYRKYLGCEQVRAALRAALCSVTRAPA